MNRPTFKIQNSFYQYAMIFLMIALTTILGEFLKRWFDYHVIGYLYLFSVLVASAAFGMGPIFSSAALSALSWNFFFMPPKFSFAIGATQDMLMCYAYFFVASLGGFLNAKIRRHALERDLLRESERLYQILINSISHELRTPLTVMLGNSAALQHENMLDDKEFVRTAAKELHRASERLNQVVENLLDMSRIESEHLVLKHEVFSVNDLIEHTVERLSPHFLKHRVNIQKTKKQESDDYISGDFKLLDHAIGNLLLNAVNYSPLETEIKVVVAKNSRNDVIIQIVDQGPGIQKEYQQKVFDKFFRIPGTPAGGVGLGLSIVKGILEAHAAGIHLLEVEHGTAFEINFRRANLPDGIRGGLS
jgi:two-component system sensor histidine kinase KdpD